MWFIGLEKLTEVFLKSHHFLFLTEITLKTLGSLMNYSCFITNRLSIKVLQDKWRLGCNLPMSWLEIHNTVEE